MLTSPNHGRSGPRKLRKGTHSCWECKRRKIRCRPSLTPGEACDGCKRRRTNCIGQDFPDDTSNAISTKLPTDGHVLDLENMVIALSARIEHFERSKGDIDHILEGTVNFRELRGQSSLEFKRVTEKLMRVWPADAIIQAILDLPGDSLGLFHGTINTLPSRELFNEINDLTLSFELPSSNAHPVVVARSLLLLATYLQNLPEGSRRILRSIGLHYHQIGTDLFQAVHQNVTCNEQLLDSIEGIECMMIECMYLNNAGDLLKAWHIANRALLRACVMCLDRPDPEQDQRFLQAETRRRIEPRLMWFRLIQLSGYLSTLLGISSQAAPCNDAYCSEWDLAQCPKDERMRRVTCAAGARILRRGELDMYDWTITNEISRMLDKSERSLPTYWWSIPDFEEYTDDKLELLQKVLQTMDQLTHYHLTAQLFLPHILGESDDEPQNARLKVLIASREVLLRYVALGGFHSVASFCRGVSCLAFAACVALCFIRFQDWLGHEQNGRSESTFDVTGCERDRTMLQSALTVMKRLSCMYEDRIAGDLEAALEHLLSLQSGVAYFVDVDLARTVRFPCQFGWAGSLCRDRKTLYIRIPAVGVVEFIG